MPTNNNGQSDIVTHKTNTWNKSIFCQKDLTLQQYSSVLTYSDSERLKIIATIIIMRIEPKTVCILRASSGSTTYSCSIP